MIYQESHLSIFTNGGWHGGWPHLKDISRVCGNAVIKRAWISALKTGVYYGRKEIIQWIQTIVNQWQGRKARLQLLYRKYYGYHACRELLVQMSFL